MRIRTGMKFHVPSQKNIVLNSSLSISFFSQSFLFVTKVILVIQYSQLCHSPILELTSEENKREKSYMWNGIYITFPMDNIFLLSLLNAYIYSKEVWRTEWNFRMNFIHSTLLTDPKKRKKKHQTKGTSHNMCYCILGSISNNHNTYSLWMSWYLFKTWILNHIFIIYIIINLNFNANIFSN